MIEEALKYLSTAKTVPRLRVRYAIRLPYLCILDGWELSLEGEGWNVESLRRGCFVIQ